MAIRVPKRSPTSTMRSLAGWTLQQNGDFRYPKRVTALRSTPLVDIPLSCRLLLLSAILTMTACKPVASDEYLERVDLVEAKGVGRQPLASPDSTHAVWADGKTAGRILFGNPGEVPFLALACETAPTGEQQLRFIRFAAADPQAQALFALVGNGHIARIPVDATWNGRAWLWEGTVTADDPDLEVLTGKRTITATLPGAGQLDLSPSPRPGLLIEECRAPLELQQPST